LKEVRSRNTGERPNQTCHRRGRGLRTQEQITAILMRAKDEEPKMNSGLVPQLVESAALRESESCMKREYQRVEQYAQHKTEVLTLLIFPVAKPFPLPYLPKLKDKSGSAKILEFFWRFYT